MVHIKEAILSDGARASCGEISGHAGERVRRQRIMP